DPRVAEDAVAQDRVEQVAGADRVAVVGGQEAPEPHLVGGAGDHVAHDAGHAAAAGDDGVGEAGQQFVEGADTAAPHEVRVPGLGHSAPGFGAVGEVVAFDDHDVGELGECRGGEQSGGAGSDDHGGGPPGGDAVRHGPSGFLWWSPVGGCCRV